MWGIGGRSESLVHSIHLCTDVFSLLYTVGYWRPYQIPGSQHRSLYRCMQSDLHCGVLEAVLNPWFTTYICAQMDVVCFTLWGFGGRSESLVHRIHLCTYLCSLIHIMGYWRPCRIPGSQHTSVHRCMQSALHFVTLTLDVVFYCLHCKLANSDICHIHNF